MTQFNICREREATKESLYSEHNWRIKSETAREERRKRVEEWEKYHGDEEEKTTKQLQRSNKKVTISLDEEETENTFNNKKGTIVTAHLEERFGEDTEAVGISTIGTKYESEISGEETEERIGRMRDNTLGSDKDGNIEMRKSVLDNFLALGIQRANTLPSAKQRNAKGVASLSRRRSVDED
jgi:hypothetical protein